MGTRRFTFPIVHTRSGGAGAEFVSATVLTKKVSGKLVAVQIRRDLGDTITTAVVPYWVTNQHALGAAPPRDDEVAAATSVALNASATVPDLDSPITNQPRFENGLRLGGNFTFSGDGTSTTHWTIEVDTDE
jgi:hypothetical protein